VRLLANHGWRPIRRGAWRVQVITASAPMPSRTRSGSARDKDWIVAIVEITNWSTKDQTLNPRDFALELPGGEKPRGFARRSTEHVAEQLDLEPKSTDAGVKIAKGQNERLVLVFELPIDATNPKLFLDSKSLSIQGAIDAGPALDALPKMADPPTATRTELGEVINGFTLTVGGDKKETELSYVDGPLPDECFGEEATRRLKRLATDRLDIEELDGATFVWSNDDDGSRRLLNYDQSPADTRRCRTMSAVRSRSG